MSYVEDMGYDGYAEYDTGYGCREDHYKLMLEGDCPKVLKETKKAVLFETSRGNFWAPKSALLLYDDDPMHTKDLNNLYAQCWFEIKYLETLF